MGTYPPIKNGTRVKATVRRSGEGDYTAEAITARISHNGKIGVVCEYHDSHGLCYGVKFEGGLRYGEEFGGGLRYGEEFEGTSLTRRSWRSSDHG
jgi:hypothetical protein